MSEWEHTPYERFKWTVYPSYHWQDWLTNSGRRVRVRRGELSGFETPAVVEETWPQYKAKEKQAGPVLGPVLERVDSENLRTYHPMERKHSTLYQDFASVDYTDLEAILDFASRYGLLGLPVQEQITPHCTASGFLDSGLTVFASTPPRPTRGGRVAPGPGFGSRISPASTARCTSA